MTLQEQFEQLDKDTLTRAIAEVVKRELEPLCERIGEIEKGQTK